MFKCSKPGCKVMLEKRDYCAEHRAAYNKKYYAEHNTHRRKKLSDAELLERKKERNRRYHRENKEKKASKMREWRSTPQGHAADVANHNRRRKNGIGFTAKEWRELLVKYNHTCLRCKATDKKLTPDHVMPLSKDGSNGIENIQPLCLDCNLWKATKIVDYR